MSPLFALLAAKTGRRNFRVVPIRLEEGAHTAGRHKGVPIRSTEDLHPIADAAEGDVVVAGAIIMKVVDIGDNGDKGSGAVGELTPYIHAYLSPWFIHSSPYKAA